MKSETENKNKAKISKRWQKVISYISLFLVVFLIVHICLTVLGVYEAMNQMNVSDALPIFLLIIGLIIVISIVLGVLLERYFDFSRHYQRMIWLIWGINVGLLVYRFFGLYLAFGVFLIFLILAIVGYPIHKK